MRFFILLGLIVIAGMIHPETEFGPSTAWVVLAALVIGLIMDVIELSVVLR